MSPEIKQKIADAKEARQQARTDKSYQIGPWRIFWFDDYNWCVQKGDDESEREYYPNLIYSLHSVFKHRIEDHADRSARTIEAILNAVRLAEREIREAIDPMLI